MVAHLPFPSWLPAVVGESDYKLGHGFIRARLAPVLYAYPVFQEFAIFWSPPAAQGVSSC
jgi:hypothetical protein